MISMHLFLLSLVASINAIPVPMPQTPDFRTLDTCPTNGAIVCSPDGSKFYLCNFGRAVPMGSVAAGTYCSNGKIVTIGASAAPTMMPPPAKPTQFPEPTSIELVKTSPPAATPTEAPMNPKPEPVKDEITSTITTTEEVTSKSTSTILVTVTGEPPRAPMETPVPEPVPTSEPSNGSTGGIVITEDIIIKTGASSKSCPRDNDFRDLAKEECATAKHAAPFITEAFKKYEINTIGEAAAILSLMMFETGNFQFNTNHFGMGGKPRPGQGTRNQMSPNFIVEYAQTFGSTDSISPGITPANINDQTDEVKNKVLALVLGDDRTWASGAWFYKNYAPCTAIMPALQKEPVSRQAWRDYITKCVETTVASRGASFEAAVVALGGTLTD
ncbi:hypothetical protein TWF225_001353 [Orbilia oligospora]|uniref:Uncharacterized protein n=1 Tax=Orbilia oligospora TaxID=2813651 RepID=A0A7C8P885_ORBOL|nr:hypothetical protein TWF751_008890 [Orbilia oligospora]KAF3191193.1 hypothetical protein TWF225_001353 [Orbilia oligospora]KAF3238717.1 hypothetical protein TWF128_011969 [Orbilia oligospora]KAF3249653.1 hypothetical protein TWF217_008849 [Orbilia oligospora]KAF3279299.1 hypothetical protein TWF132_000663 [Orbilia oligospora]